MVKPKREKKETTKDSHVIIFGTIFLLIITFVTFKFAQGVVLRPENMIVHTNLVYYDGEFSATNLTEDIKTALYVLNQSNETIYATVYEYDHRNREVRTDVEIGPKQNQFIKTNNSGVVYLTNETESATSTVKFSRWYTFKKYTLPDNFKF